MVAESLTATQKRVPPKNQASADAVKQLKLPSNQSRHKTKSLEIELASLKVWKIGFIRI